MFKRPRSDLWEVGIVPAAIGTLLTPGALARAQPGIVWLPQSEPWTYLADPFGLRRGDSTHVFVEAFDYRTKHAVIEHHELHGPGLEWRGKSTVLARPFHLSYPFLIEEDGEVFMVPESHQANEIALYRARRFPHDWVRECALLSGVRGAEASLIRHEGKWWMFYTVVGPDARDQRELMVAHADKLTGPWHEHGMNPVLMDRAGARPGGSPFVGADGHLILPVQDCSKTYGGAIRFLRFIALNEREVVCEHLPAKLTGDLVSATHQQGLHTFSRCGELTLLDAKTISRSRGRQLLDFKRRLKRLKGKLSA